MKTTIMDKYEIESDSNQFTLYKLVRKKDDAKVNPGGLERKFIGYYGDIESLIKSFPNRALLCSEFDSLSEAIKEVRAIAGEFKKVIEIIMQEAETPQEVEEAQA